MKMKDLFNGPPFEIATPSRFFFDSFSDVRRFINNHNGKTRIFYNLYTHKNGIIKLKYVWFDFDSDNWLELVKKFHYYLKEKNIMHFMIMSGKGAHLYIISHATTKSSLEAKKYLTAAHIVFCEKMNFKIGEDVDQHIIGDIRRVATIPFTFNTKRQRFAIFISEKDLNTSKEEIYLKAKKQNKSIYMYGKTLFDFESLDISKTNFDNYMIKIKDVDLDLNTLDDKIKKIIINLPQPVIRWLTTQTDWKARTLFTLYMREKCYPISITKAIAKYFYSKKTRKDNLKNNWIHYLKVKTAQLIYHRNGSNDMLFPSITKLIEEGYLLEEERKYFKNIYN